VEKTSRLRSRDPVASGVKCGLHGGMNSKMKSWTISWLSLKTKVEPGLRGSRVMSGDWRRLHRVRGVSSGAPENHWVPWLIHKAKTDEPINTKHWYRKETDLWAEFGRGVPFDRIFPSTHSVKVPAVGSASSFGKRAVPRLKAETFGSA
jgi:hypothetical protein